MDTTEQQNETTVRRDRIIKISVTDAEHAEITAKAKAKVLDAATFARQAALLAARDGAQ